MSGIFKKIKKRRILVISGGLKAGLHCLYISAGNDTWEIVKHTFFPYPQKIAQLFEHLSAGPAVTLSLSDIAWLDCKLSFFYTDCVKNTLSQLPAALRTPHCAVLNKPSFWRGRIDDGPSAVNWDMAFGDAQHLASSLRIPVVTDLIRQQCLSGGQGTLPVQYGNLRIASPCGGIVIFINIGLIARMTIIDTGSASILVDSDTGPGTCCINSLVKKHALGIDNEGFDRDGSLAGQGTVDGDCCKLLSGDAWFSLPAPKAAVPPDFSPLLSTPHLLSLRPADQIATVTALTARTIYDFYRREFKQLSSGQTVFLSGGGSHNQTLQHFLKTYFDTIPVKSVEELGIPVDMKIPLALGLTVNAFVGGLQVPWESSGNVRIPAIGKWVFP